MRIGLVGAVETTRVALRALRDSDASPEVMVTLPIEKLGRHSDAVDLRLEVGGDVPVIESADINAEETLGALRSYDLDYIFVIDWSQLCKRPFLELPRRGAIGFHPAPLPQNRGRAVIPWTILQDRRDTGSTIFWMDEGMDTGDIFLQERIPVSPIETATTLYEAHLEALARMVTRAVEHLRSGEEIRRPQAHAQATYCAQRVPEDGRVDWRSPAEDVWRLIRATTRPYPGAFTTFKGNRLVIWNADLVSDAPYWGVPGQVQVTDNHGALVQCGDRSHVRLIEVQLEEGEATEASLVLRRHARLGTGSQTRPW